jgi:hypothetical protein
MGVRRRSAHIISPQDEAILEFISQVRYATAAQVTGRLYKAGSKTFVRSRMTKLAGGADHVAGQWLYRFPMPSVASGNRLRVFALGTRSRSALIHDLGLSVRHSLPYQHRRLGYSFLRHALAMTACAVAATCFDRQQSAVKLLNTRYSYQLAGVQPRLPVIPDLWLLWIRNGKHYPLWLEVDCESESQRKWAQSLHGRVRFIESGAYARAFQTSTVMIATLVVGETAESAATRQKALCRWTQNLLAELGLKSWSGMFRFNSLAWSDDFSRLGLFEAPLWYRVDSAIKESLFPG